MYHQGLFFKNAFYHLFYAGFIWTNTSHNIFFQCHHLSSQTSWSSSQLWLKSNQLLKLGRPVGAVTLSRWEWWWNERWTWGARGALNLISTNYPDHGYHGRLPLSWNNAHGMAGNRTRGLMGISQELWPPGHEAGHILFLEKEKPREKIKILLYLAFIVLVVTNNCSTTNTLTKKYCGHERDICTVCF